MLSTELQYSTILLFQEEFLSSVHQKLPAGQIVNTPYAKLLSNLSKHTGRNSPQPAPAPTVSR